VPCAVAAAAAGRHGSRARRAEVARNGGGGAGTGRTNLARNIPARGAGEGRVRLGGVLLWRHLPFEPLRSERAARRLSDHARAAACCAERGGWGARLVRLLCASVAREVRGPVVHPLGTWEERGGGGLPRAPELHAGLASCRARSKADGSGRDVSEGQDGNPFTVADLVGAARWRPDLLPPGAVLVCPGRTLAISRRKLVPPRPLLADCHSPLRIALALPAAADTSPETLGLEKFVPGAPRSAQGTAIRAQGAVARATILKTSDLGSPAEAPGEPEFGS